MTRTLEVAFFGLPLAAYLLHRDGVQLNFAVLSPIEGAVGRRRLERTLGADRVLAASELGDDLGAAVEQRWASAPPDLLVSWFWTRRLPEAWLRRPRFGAIGAHPSLLPRHRGPNPYFWAIDAGDVETGITVHRLTAEYDEGDVLARTAIQVGQRNAWQLARALDRPSLCLLRRVVATFATDGSPPSRPQALEGVTWAPEPSKDLLRVNWTWPTERVLRRVRALAPVPGLAIEIRGVRLFITSARAALDYPAALVPGEAATLGRPPTALVIRTGDGAIVVERATLSGDSEDDAEHDLDAQKVAALVDAAGMIESSTPEGNG